MSDGRRREVYVVNGVEHEDRRYASMVTPAFVAFLARSMDHAAPRYVRAERFFVAVAQHETNFATNEIDYEAPDENGRVFISDGLFQLSADEATHAGYRGANLIDPVASMRVFSTLIARYQLALFDAARRNAPAGFLAIAHNQGIGTYAPKGKGALGALYRHGCNWGDPTIAPALDDPKSYRGANPTAKIVPYGDDCLTGGPRWHEVG